jgi:hypothetical protein
LALKQLFDDPQALAKARGATRIEKVIDSNGNWVGVDKGGKRYTFPLSPEQEAIEDKRIAEKRQQAIQLSAAQLRRQAQEAKHERKITTKIKRWWDNLYPYRHECYECGFTYGFYLFGLRWLRVHIEPAPGSRFEKWLMRLTDEDR